MSSFTLLALAGCVALLPRSESAAKSGWKTYEAARETFDRIVPYETRKDQLNELGFDPLTNPNVTVLTYADIIRRFLPSAGITPENLDRGIRECIAARDACRGYEIDVKSIRRKRAGNFWLDSLNFKRRTEISGWRFNGLIVIKEELVVYKLYGGQPMIREAEETRNPLGPLQGAMESASRRLGP